MSSAHDALQCEGAFYLTAISQIRIMETIKSIFFKIFEITYSYYSYYSYLYYSYYSYSYYIFIKTIEAAVGDGG